MTIKIINSRGMENFLMRIFLAIAVVSAVSTQGLLANQEATRTSKVSDEWRSTYKFNKDIYEKMQSNLKFVIDSHEVLANEHLSSELRSQLETAQADALKKIVNEDKKVMPYLLREYANNIRNQMLNYKELEREPRKALHQALASREQALEAAIKSIRLSAIPFLSDLHARAVKGKANRLAKRTLKLLDEITRIAKIDAEKADFQRMMHEKEAEAAVETPQFDSEPARSIILEDFDKGARVDN